MDDTVATMQLFFPSYDESLTPKILKHMKIVFNQAIPKLQNPDAFSTTFEITCQSILHAWCAHEGGIYDLAGKPKVNLPHISIVAAFLDFQIKFIAYVRNRVEKLMARNKLTTERARILLITLFGMEPLCTKECIWYDSDSDKKNKYY